MQTFINTDGGIWQFEDDVLITEKAGVYSFQTAEKVPLTQVPTTLVPHTIPAPTAAQLLGVAQQAKLNAMSQAHDQAASQAVSFKTVAGVTQTFAADPRNAAQIIQALVAFSAGVPAGFSVVAQDDSEVAFTLADLQGLALTLAHQAWTARQHLQSLKSQVTAATTETEVNAISNW